MHPKRETYPPRHKADKAHPATAALTPAQPGVGTTFRTLGAQAALLTATTLPVVAGPFFLTSAASPHVDGAAAALQAATQSGTGDPVALAERELRASRSLAARELAPITMKPRAVDQKWATAPLNVWAQPAE